MNGKIKRCPQCGSENIRLMTRQNKMYGMETGHTEYYYQCVECKHRTEMVIDGDFPIIKLTITPEHAKEKALLYWNADYTQEQARIDRRKKFSF